MNRKTRFFLAALLLTGGVAYLMYTGVSRSAVYYLTLAEYEERRDEMADEFVRIAGRVTPGSVSRSISREGEAIAFRIGDFVEEGAAADGPQLEVRYLGIVPDMFKSEGGSDVIVEGRVENGILQARSVMTSCPSKYEAGSEDLRPEAP